MASKTLGRIACPISCGHTAAHVKIKTDKATTAYPYVHCLGCGCQLHTKGEDQARYLLASTRPEALDGPPAAPPTPTPTPAPEPAKNAPTAPEPALPRRFGFGRAA